jgi:hypothetical protein
MIYTTSQVQKQFSVLLKKALSEGQIQFKTKDGQLFIIRPVRAHTAKKSPFEVGSIKLPITRADILQSIRDSRERY